MKYFHKTLLILTLLSTTFISACNDDSNSELIDPDVTNTDISTIPDQLVIYSRGLNLDLPQTDSENNAAVYTVESTGAENPFTLDNPLTYDVSTKSLTWQTTGEEIGNYTIKIDRSLEATSEFLDSVELEILVTTLGEFGQRIYESNCATCHANDGTGVSGPAITHISTKDEIVEALNIVSQMQSLADSFSDLEIEAIAYYIHTRLSGVDFHDSYSAVCAECHDDYETTGLLLAHARTTTACGACHSTSTYVPVLLVDHDEVVPSFCGDCHYPNLLNSLL